MWAMRPRVPCLIVEAKHLDAPVGRGVSQGVNYCIQEGADHFVVTNGNRWEGYNVRLSGRPVQEQRVFEFEVTGNNPSVMDLLWLWPGNHRGRTVSPNFTKQAAPSAIDSTADATARTPSKRPREQVAAAPDLQPRDERSIARYRHEKGRQPDHIEFPSKPRMYPQNWVEVQAMTVTWLVETGALTPDMCPLRNLVLKKPPREGDADYASYFRSYRVVAGVCIGTWRDGAGHARATKRILEACGQDPRQVILGTRMEAPF